MIKINLLPADLRKEELSKSINLSDYLAFPAILVALAIALNLLLGVCLVYKKMRLVAFNMQWDDFYPNYKPVEEIKCKIKTIDERLLFFNGIMGPQILWSGKLNILSDNLPNGVWFRKVEITDNGSVNIDGSVVSLAEDEVGILNKFVSNLKKDVGFFKDFRDAELKSLLKRNIRDLEVTDFTLVFYAK